MDSSLLSIFGTNQSTNGIRSVDLAQLSILCFMGGIQQDSEDSWCCDQAVSLHFTWIRMPWMFVVLKSSLSGRLMCCLRWLWLYSTVVYSVRNVNICEEVGSTLALQPAAAKA
jgi:hypothetical protein